MKPFLSAFVALFAISGAFAAEPCRIQVIDAENGWPVPLVELRTVHQVVFVTDNAGVVAFDLPESMGRETWFTVSSDGYRLKKDQFGSSGFRIRPEPGGKHVLEIERTIIAKRLGRLTGAGIFGESQKLGEHLDWEESGALGCDSVMGMLYEGKRFWSWGDTLMANYPLGIFHMTGATTEAHPLRNSRPPLEIKFDYFRKPNGDVRAIANVAPEDPGPTWLSGCVVLRDEKGDERLCAHYAKITPPLSTYRKGLCVWNKEREHFESVAVLWEPEEGDDGSDRRSGVPLTDGTNGELQFETFESLDEARREIEIPGVFPVGHPVRWKDEEGADWVLFGGPFPTMRVPASYEAWLDPEQWEEVEATEEVQSDAGESIQVHRGSMVWNEHRQRWIAIFCQFGGGETLLGNLWYTEAESPFGPWSPAVKILSHREMSFYNPMIHTGIAPGVDASIYFEGTYTTLFTNHAVPTPRHNYNQILYALDLDAPGLLPAQPGRK